jgi:Polyketide cyclase / dehydrase and lipid transport
MTFASRAAVAGTLLVGAALVARGGLTLDIGIGRRLRPLGPIALEIAAPPELVFDVIAAPYLGRTPRALRGKLEVIERGADLVLAAHFTSVTLGLTVTTVETVRFERPRRVTFRLLKGPVPHVLERYELRASPNGTAFEYHGEMGTDLWALGAWWAAVVAPSWERTVASSLDAIRTEAERRAQSRS